MRIKDRLEVSFEDMGMVYLNASNLEREYRRTYNSWRAMRERCFNKKHKYYKYYGGKGVSVCPRWASFRFFLEDLGIKPEGLMLDRIDGGKGYFMGNCRWTSPTISCVNRKMGKNKAGFRGVFIRKSGRYAAVVKKEKKTFVVGTFDTAKEAAIAYNIKALELYGVEAKLNEV